MKYSPKDLIHDVRQTFGWLEAGAPATDVDALAASRRLDSHSTVAVLRVVLDLQKAGLAIAPPREPETRTIEGFDRVRHAPW